LGFGKVAVEAQLVRLTKRDERRLNHTEAAERVQDGVQIKKLDQEEQIVFGEVYAPGFPDSQGDFMSTAEIKKMAYNFMRKSALSNIDVNHTQERSGSYVVESFIAREDDSIFIPGSWVLGVKAPDLDDVAGMDDGELQASGYGAPPNHPDCPGRVTFDHDRVTRHGNGGCLAHPLRRRLQREATVVPRSRRTDVRATA